MPGEGEKQHAPQCHISSSHIGPLSMNRASFHHSLIHWNYTLTHLAEGLVLRSTFLPSLPRASAYLAAVMPGDIGFRRESAVLFQRHHPADITLRPQRGAANLVQARRRLDRSWSNVSSRLR